MVDTTREKEGLYILFKNGWALLFAIRLHYTFFAQVFAIIKQQKHVFRLFNEVEKPVNIEAFQDVQWNEKVFCYNHSLNMKEFSVDLSRLILMFHVAITQQK